MGSPIPGAANTNKGGYMNPLCFQGGWKPRVNILGDCGTVSRLYHCVGLTGFRSPKVFVGDLKGSLALRKMLLKILSFCWAGWAWDRCWIVEYLFWHSCLGAEALLSESQSHRSSWRCVRRNDEVDESIIFMTFQPISPRMQSFSLGACQGRLHESQCSA